MSAAFAGLRQRVVPLRERLAGWWEGLSARERTLVTILAGIALIALLLSAVVNPIRAARREALTTIRVHDTLQAGLRSTGAGGGIPQRTGDPAIILSSSAAQHGVTPTQIVPDGRGARAELAEADLGAVLRWIAEVERSSPLRIASVEVRRGNTPGLVVASLVFAR